MTSPLLAVITAFSPYAGPISANHADWRAADERRWSPLPQEMPFQYYATVSYGERWRTVGGLALSKITPPDQEPTDETREMFKGKTYFKINNREILISQHQPFVRFDSSQNSVMAAYGWSAWGKTWQQITWSQEATRMANLWVVSPDRPVVFNVTTGKFDSSSDVDGEAVSAFWMAKMLLLNTAEPASSRSDVADPEAWAKIGRIAARPVLSPAQALLVSFLSTEVGVPDQLQLSAKSRLKDYRWPTRPKSFLENVYLTWSLALASRVMPELKSRIPATLDFAWRKDQFRDDPLGTSNPTFGVISQKPGAVENDSVLAAMAVLEAGAALEDVETMERGASALRAACGLLRVNLNLPRTPSMPFLLTSLGFTSYGVQGPDMFEDFSSFEAGEGKICASFAYTNLRFGRAYEAAPGQWIGIDGVRVFEGKFYDLMKNLSQPFVRLTPYAEEVTHNGTRRPLRPLLRRPTVVGADLVSMEPDPVVRVYTGGSVSSAEAMDEKSHFRIVATFKGAKNEIVLNPDDLGFSGTVPQELLAHPMVVRLEYGNSKSTKEFDLNPDPDLNQPSSWTPYGAAVMPGHVKRGVLSTAAHTGTKRGTGNGFFVSKPFYGKNRLLTFSISGQSRVEGEAKIELLDAATGTQYYEFFPTELTPFKVEWDLALFGNRMFTIRVSDGAEDAFIEIKDFSWSD